MKWIREILPRGNEAAFASALLLLYAMVLFLSPDPEWTIWAAQMAMGVLYVPDPPALQGVAPFESVRVMSAAGALVSLAMAALLALQIKTSRERRHCDRSHGTVPHMKVSLGQMEGKGGEHDGRHPV
ncbi:MAG: hypothetical protein ACYC37_05165 [Desulfobacteria bacterium]